MPNRRTQSTVEHPVLARIWRLQRLRRRPRGLLYAAEAALAWLRELLRPTGMSYVLSVVSLLVQNVCLDVFLARFVSQAVWFILVVEIPLVIHVAWFWRPESAHRAAPVQWLVYSWIHAAKVVVLFCRVMPRLPTTITQDVDSEAMFGTASEDATLTILGYGFSLNVVADIFSAPILATLLLITPVFYALLMFRTSKAIFGSFSKRITVCRIMHFDMLWHVVIDMVDQVNIFYLSRASEWGGSKALERDSQIVTIQNAAVFLLFLSFVLQAQALPGVFMDQWYIPEPPPLPAELLEELNGQELTGGIRSHSSQSLGGRSSLLPSTKFMGSSARLSTSSFPRSSEGRTSLAAPPSWLSEATSSLRRPPAVASLAIPAVPESYLAQAQGDIEEPPEDPEVEQVRPSLQPPLPGLQRRALQPQRSVSTLSAVGEDAEPVARAATCDSGRAPTANSIGHRALSQQDPSLPRATTTPQDSRTPTPITDYRRSLSMAAHGEAFLKREKERRDRLQDIINQIHRHSVVVARKRSAVGSIFFIDIPFLALRLSMAFMMGSTYFPGFGIKNAICIVLNAMQWGVVSLSNRESAQTIQRDLATYLAKFHGGPEAGVGDDSPKSDNLLSPTRSDKDQSAPSTPQQSPMSPRHASPLAASAQRRGLAAGDVSATAASRRRAKEKWKRDFLVAQKKVRQETERTTSVCTHFWSLFFAFGVGLLLSKGEGFITRIWSLVQDIDVG
ncbi:unnamed protein product [Prorocentrum cordatum]|uniref:Uncharacterized protein n=1 Tax=Prorocentrum cordatum TaxID=2364126 RepID=A0ABN9QRI2_9DINO|nr:unnamed protein product [Polarella glacialis]